MNLIFETSRLLLREFNLEDASNLFHLNSNPNVVRYTGDEAFEAIEEAKLFLENYQDYHLNGYGRWAVITKENNRFIGWCGLKLSDNETDIGFRFFEEEWNKGYATESALACLEYGFEQLRINQIVGRAMRANVASIKVLEKIGLTFEKDFVFEDQEGVLYKIETKSEKQLIFL